MSEIKHTHLSKKSKFFTWFFLFSYPFMFLFGCFSLIFILPKFKTIFDDMLKGEPLPGLTSFFLSISDAYKSLGFFGLNLTLAFFVFALLPFFYRNKVYGLKNRNLILSSLFLLCVLFYVILAIAMFMPMMMIMDKL